MIVLWFALITNVLRCNVFAFLRMLQNFYGVTL